MLRDGSIAENESDGQGVIAEEENRRILLQISEELNHLFDTDGFFM